MNYNEIFAIILILMMIVILGYFTVSIVNHFDEVKKKNIKKEREELNMKNFNWYYLVPIVFFIIFPILMILSLRGGADNTCGEGYHWEEDYRQTIGGCVHD